jgi:hypothetical protein
MESSTSQPDLSKAYYKEGKLIFYKEGVITVISKKTGKILYRQDDNDIRNKLKNSDKNLENKNTIFMPSFDSAIALSPNGSIFAFIIDTYEKVAKCVYQGYPHVFVKKIKMNESTSEGTDTDQSILEIEKVPSDTNSLKFSSDGTKLIMFNSLCGKESTYDLSEFLHKQ